MVSPQSPRNVRYGPSEHVGVSVGGVNGAGSGVVRKPVPGMGLGVEGAGVGTSSLASFQNNALVGGDEVMSHNILAERARQAFLEAVRRGDDMVELDEWEWQAWQQNEAMDREIERRVAERLEEEKRRKVMVPTPAASPHLLTRTLHGESAAPGILTGGGFAPLGRSTNLGQSNGRLRSVETPVLPRSTSPLTGAFPDEPESEHYPQPIRSGVHYTRPISLSTPVLSSQRAPNLHASPRQTASVSSVPAAAYSPRPPTLRSEADTMALDSDGDGGSAVSLRSVASSPSFSAEAYARRKKRQELREQLEL